MKDYSIILTTILIIYCLITTTVIIIMAVHVIKNINDYSSKFKKNLNYVDNVIRAIMEKQIELSKFVNINFAEIEKGLNLLKDSLNSDQLTESNLIKKYPDNNFLSNHDDNVHIKVIGATSDSGKLINQNCPICGRNCKIYNDGTIKCINDNCTFEFKDGEPVHKPKTIIADYDNIKFNTSQLKDLNQFIENNPSISELNKKLSE